MQNHSVWKQLTDDLVEASKVSTGNVELHMTRIQVQQLLQQAYGEFDEKLSAKGLQTILNQGGRADRDHGGRKTTLGESLRTC